MWALTPNGEIVGFIGRTKVDESFDPAALYSKLIQVQRKWMRIRAGTDQPTADLIQRNDIAILSSQDDAVLSSPEGSLISPFEQFRVALSETIDPINGGLPRDGIQQLFPNAWRYMALTGQITTLRESLNPMLMSPMMDLLDGGFFRGDRAGRRVDRRLSDRRHPAKATKRSVQLLGGQASRYVVGKPALLGGGEPWT